MFQSFAQSFTRTWRPTEIVLSTWSDIKWKHPLRSRRIRGYLGRPTGWEPGMRQGFPDSAGGEPGQGQTGVLQFLIQTWG